MNSSGTKSGCASLDNHAENLSAEIGRVSEKIRLNSPADLGNSRLGVRTFMIRSQLAQGRLDRLQYSEGHSKFV
jgi:hypothetical protein